MSLNQDGKPLCCYKLLAVYQIFVEITDDCLTIHEYTVLIFGAQFNSFYLKC